MKDNVGALAGKFETNLEPDPGIRAGHKRFFSLQSEFLGHEYEPECELRSRRPTKQFSPAARFFRYDITRARSAELRARQGTIFVAALYLVNNNVDCSGVAQR